MRYLIFTILTIFATPCFADWGVENTIYTVLHSIDWSQTRSIVRERGAIFEVNPILGKTPSIGRVNTYFATTLIAHYLISNNLPYGWKTVFDTTTIFMEFSQIEHNHSIGIKMAW